MKRSRNRRRALWIGIAATCAATEAAAHGFGQRYDLPLPLRLYIGAAAAAVAVSFVVVGMFLREVPRAYDYPRIGLPGWRTANHGVAAFVRLCSLALFIVLVVAGLFGDQNPYRNIAPTLVWVIGWVGLAYVSAFVGDVWALLNPWRTAFVGVDRFSRWAFGRGISLRLPYPERLGVWPGFLLMLAFSWTELVYPSPAVPSHLAWFAIAYSILTWTGMIVYGEAWLQRGEIFTLVFGTLARFAPTEAGLGREFEIVLRPPGAGLLDSSSISTSMVAFVLLLLSTVLYDGAIGTPEWSVFESAVIPYVPLAGNLATLAVRTIGLIAFWFIFFGAYVSITAGMSAATVSRPQPIAIARAFALTLVPIVIGYHLAHYLTFLLIQGQYIIPLVSDPFGFGWDLFGTAGYRVDIAIVDARFAWYTAVTAILLGHIAAVYLAHRKAMQTFEMHGAALRSQVPLTVLMVVYTFVSLSILAEPIVQRRAPAQPSNVVADVAVPEDAVIPEPGSGRLQPVGPGKIARQRLTYRALASAFHDGTHTDVADILYSIMFSYRWGLPNGDRYDPAVEVATRPLRHNLVGIKFTGTDTTSKSFRVGEVDFVRQLYLIDIYLALSPVDAEQDAAVAPPWTTLPWHLIVLMEEAVSEGRAAFSQAEAARREAQWLDLVRSDAINIRLAALVERFERDSYRPEILQTLVTPEEARKRWAALAQFYKERGHFLVTNGPYVLKSWSRNGATLEAFRDLSYPLGVGSYDSYAVPRRGFVTKIERDGEEIKVSGDIELVTKHQRSYDIVRQPLPSARADLVKQAAPECRYVVTDASKRVVLAGRVQLADDSAFHIDFKDKLAPGEFTLLAEIIVAGNTMNAEIQRIPLFISP